MKGTGMSIKYSTYLSNLKKGDKPCYVARVKHNGTVAQNAFLKAISERSGESVERVRFGWDLAMNELKAQLKNGNRVELEQLAAGLAVHGTFDSANAAWDPAKNRLAPFVNVKGDLKAALARLSAENVTEGAVVTIKSVLDTVRKENGVIATVNVYLSGVNVKIDPTKEDEGAWLEDMDGTIVQRGTVTRSDMTTADVTFAALPPSGKYRFVLAGRNGADSAFGVSMGKKIVEVVNG